MEEFGPRFPPMSDAYDLELRRSAHVAYKKLALSIPTRRLYEGVYAFVSGPTYVVHSFNLFFFLFFFLETCITILSKNIHLDLRREQNAACYV